MADATDPIRPDELEGLFGGPRSVTAKSCALAVSGGSDSTALMVLFAEWLSQTGRPASHYTVLTVDHGLRPESGAEAEAVGRQAEALGFRHAILVWPGAKPSTALQAAARVARYRLMADHMRADGIPVLMTAHTLDDQAETLLMRLARGSGLDGLCAMAPLSPLLAADQQLDGLMIARPLLGVPKLRLQATLQARGIGWIEDPSNQSRAFERVRLRAARSDLEALGLTGEMLALSARRLQRARAALEESVEAFLAPASANVHTDPCGFFRLERARLRSAPMEIVVRVLTRAILAGGGSPEPVSLAKVEAIADSLCSEIGTHTWTLGRALITATPERITIEREPGRAPMPATTLAPGQEALWDGRFWVRAASGLERPVDVRALATEGLREVRKSGAVPEGVPVGALRALPGFWREAALLAVPNLGFWSDATLRSMFSAEFRPLRQYNSKSAGSVWETQ